MSIQYIWWVGYSVKQHFQQYFSYIVNKYGTTVLTYNY